MSKISDLQNDIKEIKKQLGYSTGKKRIFLPGSINSCIVPVEFMVSPEDTVDDKLCKISESNTTETHKLRVNLIKRIEQLECNHPQDSITLDRLVDRPDYVIVQCRLCGKLLESGYQMQGMAIEDARERYRK